MKAVRIHETGGPEVLRFEDVPVPVPSGGQALVPIQASGGHFLDSYHAIGRPTVPFPYPLGLAAGGVAEAGCSHGPGGRPGGLGDEGCGAQPGDRVEDLRPGT
jgi:NADPH2:quinone reductase